MSESFVILARLSFKKHSCRTLRLCHVEPTCIYKERTPAWKDFTWICLRLQAFYMAREQTVSNKAQGGQQFLHQGSLLSVEDPVTFWVSRLDYQPLFGKWARAPPQNDQNTKALHTQTVLRCIVLSPHPTILHAAKAMLCYCHMRLARRFHSVFC